ncbi:MAG: MarC family protein [Caldimicrobium sp.]
MELTFFLKSFIALFTIIDPIGGAPFFLSITAGYNEIERRKIALRASLTVLITLSLFLFFGPYLLSLFNISLSSFKIAGGILLFLTAMEMLLGKVRSVKATPEEETRVQEKEDVSVVPLGIPYLAGPGAITTVIILTERGSFSEKFMVFLSIILVSGITYTILSHSNRIFKFFGELGTKAVVRLLGLILASIAVEYIFHGIREYLVH